MKLYGRHGKPKVQKILITCKYAGVDNLKFHHIEWEVLKTAEFLHKNPMGRCPVLETNEGCMYESNAILRHFAALAKQNDSSNTLYGSNAWEHGLIEQWLDFFSGTVESSIATIMFTIFGTRVHKAQEFAMAEENLKKYMQIMENHLKMRTFLVGNQLTIADICYVVHFGNLFQFYLDENDLTQFPHVVRWFQFLRNQQPFLQVMGKQIYCKQKFKLNPITEESQLPHTKLQAGPQQSQKKEGGEKKQQLTPEEIEERKKQNQQKKAQQKDQKSPGKKQQQQQQQQKKQVKEEVKQQEKQQESEETAAAKEKAPPKNQQELQYLYDFKTFYVNEKDKHKAIQQFYKEHDPSKFSVWFLKYVKYTGDGEKLIPTNNLMGRFLQQLDSTRKEMFGVHGVYGEEPNLEIRGCWLWLGTAIHEGMKQHESFDYYTFEKCDFSNEKHKKIFEEYWTGLEDDVSLVEGLRGRTIKYFK